MKIVGNFRKNEDPIRKGIGDDFVSSATMDELVKLLNPQIYNQSVKEDGGHYRAIVYPYDLGNARIQEAFRLFYEREGRRPTPWHLLRTPFQKEYFYQSLRREYTKVDLDKAPLLTLFGTRWIAKMAPREDFGPLQIIGNKQLIDPKPYGRIDPYVVRGMNSWLVEELKKRDVKGFTVRGIEILRRKPEHQLIWEPWSTVTMPVCRLPLVNSWGEPFTEPGRGCHYECGPYQPEEMVFLRSEVEALGEFDIAVGQEQVGMGNNDCYHPVIVSQRFRKIMTELKVPGVAYAPVWLKEPGEPLWVNPWESFLGPYPEPVPVA